MSRPSNPPSRPAVAKLSNLTRVTTPRLFGESTFGGLFFGGSSPTTSIATKPAQGVANRQ